MLPPTFWFAWLRVIRAWADWKSRPIIWRREKRSAKRPTGMESLAAAWANFQSAREKLAATDTGTSLTASAGSCLVPITRLRTPSGAKAEEIGGKSYAISHAWQQTPSILSAATSTSTGAYKQPRAACAPVRTVSSRNWLNRNDQHLWGCFQWPTLRLLRTHQSDPPSLRRVRSRSDDGWRSLPDFVLLWLLLHQSRFEAERPSNANLKMSQAARTEGVRVLDGLRDASSTRLSISARASSRIRQHTLREHLRSGALDKQDYYGRSYAWSTGCFLFVPTTATCCCTHRDPAGRSATATSTPPHVCVTWPPGSRLATP